MTGLLLVLGTALMLGALHAFDPDHLAAVTSFVARRPTRAGAIGFSLRWGAGHAATLALVGLVTTLFRVSVARDLTVAAEMAVGVMLVGLGLWVLTGLARGSLLLRPHAHRGAPSPHTHLHRPGHGATGRHPAFWIGALHGLAGSAGLMVVIPVGLMASSWGVLAYVASFSLGVVVAMSAYALAIGGLFERTARPASRWQPWLSAAAGSGTLLLGLAWIARTLAGPVA